MKHILLICVKLILLQIGQIIAEDHDLVSVSNNKQRQIIADSITDPCNNFLQYACGSWSQVFAEAGDKYNNTIEMLDYNVNKEMSDIFNKFSPEGKPKFIQEAHKYYKSCVNLQNYEPIKYLMLVMENVNNQTDWFKTLAKLRRYGFNKVFIAQSDFIWVNDSRQVLISLDKANFEPISYDYLKTISEHLETTDYKDLKKLWLEIESFEMDLQQLDDIEDVEVEHEEEHFIAIKDLPLDWLQEYLKVILNQTELEPQMKIYLSNVPYMKALEKLLKKYDKNSLIRYLEIRFLVFLLLEEPYEFNQINCLSNTRRLMPYAMHWLYEQQHPELQKEYQNIYQIYDNVRKSFNKTLTENKYKFNKTDVEYLLNKVNSMELRLNNLPRTGQIDALSEFYQNLNLNVDNFYENHLKLEYLNFHLPIDLVYNNNKRIFDDTYYITDEHNSWPYFLRDANILVLPLTLLQQPIYTPGLDDIYQYSTLGYMITNGIFHGFDTEGLAFNGNGTKSSINFEEYPLFNASLNCLLEINPENIDEQIVYANGLRYTYETYFALNSDALQKTQQIHDKDITMKEVFFLNYAQTFCDTSDKPTDVEFTNTLKYFPKFSETFKCSKNQALYSPDNCHLW